MLPAICLVGGELFAFQPRIWAVNTPKQVEATYSREMLGGVLVRSVAGKSCLIRHEDLSPADLNYLKFHVPPEVAVDVSCSTRELGRTEWSREDDDTVLYTFNISVEKRSKFAYKGRLIAELFVLGGERLVDDDSRLVLMSYQSKSFQLSEEKKSLYAFSAPEVPFNAYRASWIMVPSAAERGKTYRGAIVAVSDSEGALVACEHDLDVDWLIDDLPKSIEALRKFYRDYPGSVESRHFNRSFRKLEPPRVPWFRRHKGE